jgi:hypothetical protein
VSGGSIWASVSASKPFYPKGFPDDFLGRRGFSVDMLNGK